MQLGINIPLSRYLLVPLSVDRFPTDFMFQLTAEEFNNLKSHFAISSLTWGGRRKLPQAFTECIRQILESARANLSRTVNTTQVVSNWLIGRGGLKSNALRSISLSEK